MTDELERWHPEGSYARTHMTEQEYRHRVVDRLGAIATILGISLLAIVLAAVAMLLLAPSASAAPSSDVATLQAQVRTLNTQLAASKRLSAKRQANLVATIAERNQARRELATLTASVSRTAGEQLAALPLVSRYEALYAAVGTFPLTGCHDGRDYSLSSRETTLGTDGLPTSGNLKVYWMTCSS